MALKQFTCNFYKELQIGKRVKFKNGFFETEDPGLQAQIEQSSGFGVHIHYKDSIEEMERIGRERQENTAAEKARKRKEFLDEMDAEEKAESEKSAKKETEVEAVAAKKKNDKRLKAADRIL